ncbi:MAG: LON peptidase substrate-binding domain-containing protein [Pirellulales bacterium]|nr:LON peptidase substrate-binding domain-containing protein [Pirellulales bacterium]
MSAFDLQTYSFEQFSGVNRLFPLPNLVLFPHVMQPLHIFEPRYREMLEDALATDRLITMALLAEGWESNYEGRPPIRSMACLGRITTHFRLADGTYNVLLLGLRRVRIVRELEPKRAFREAQLELCEDFYPPQEAPRHSALQRQLRESLVQLLPLLPDVHEQLDQLLENDVSLGMLTDVLGYTLDVDLREKQALLEETNVYDRAEMLLGHLSVLSGNLAGERAEDKFPPSFSAN